MKSEHAAMGPRLRELRVEAGISQGDAAKRLAISPAYLSLVEKGKRPVPMPMLVGALALYGVAMEGFLASLGEGKVDAELARLLDEPLLKSLSLTRRDLTALSAEPKFVATITALFNLYKNARRELDRVSGGERAGETDPPVAHRGPFDEVAGWLESSGSFFPELEALAESYRVDEVLTSRPKSRDLVRVLRERFDLDVRHDLGEDGVLWRITSGGDVLSISPSLGEPRLAFELARVIALRAFARDGIVRPLLEAFDAAHDESRGLLELELASYFAGACLVPYAELHAEATRTRYDVEWLASRFEVSYETVAHRLMNLRDPKKRGVPMHLVRSDAAGNVSRRVVADGLRRPLDHGACPKLAVHAAFLTPGVMRKQYSRFPDDETFFCFARVEASRTGASLANGIAHSIGLGCAAGDAKRFVYADELGSDWRRAAVPVGPSCRSCEHVDCAMRSSPSLKFASRIDSDAKRDNRFSPVLERNRPDGRKSR